MTAVAPQPKRTIPQRRIIERPRLIKRLENSNARTILLIAPAGYGKTTLARQWGSSLARAIWVSATRSHRDVVTFSEDVAKGVDALGGDAASFIEQYMRARPNPQRAAREIANALAPRIENARAQWLVIDDYHELAESPEVEEMVRILRERLTCRFLVASRVQPEWATGREVIHGEVEEIGAEDLALTPEETTQVLGRRPDLEPLIEQAKGWPAVITLAAGLKAVGSREDALPTMLHRYVAEELFRSATESTRDGLISLALLPDLSPARLKHCFAESAEPLVQRAHELGFLSGDDQPEMHPLLRDFLLTKLAENPNADERVRRAVQDALDAESWDLGLDLVLRFELRDLVDPVLQRAFKPLVRSGRLGTLASFAERIRTGPGFPPPAVDVVEAEVALRDGQFELAAEIGARASSRLPAEHTMRSRTHSIIGRAEFFLSDFAAAETAFAAAATSAEDETDETEGVFGIATTRIFAETGDPSTQLALLSKHRHLTPDHLLRYWTADFTWRRWHGGLRGLKLATPRQAFKRAADPQARTSFAYGAAHVLGQRGEYTQALEYLTFFSNDTELFDLAFARPYVNWMSAFINLGLRKAGAAERSLQLVEEAVERDQHPHHDLNCRILRARMLLQTDRADAALEIVKHEPTVVAFPSWLAEYEATRALVLACIGENKLAAEWSQSATGRSGCLEVIVLAKAADAVAASRAGSSSAAVDLFCLAEELAIWDPVLCAIRSSRDLLAAVIVEET
ncbi:MAG TPA: AAA family ATPase, partial [Gaiellaceae bacterium]